VVTITIVGVTSYTKIPDYLQLSSSTLCDQHFKVYNTAVIISVWSWRQLHTLHDERVNVHVTQPVLHY